MTNQDWLISIFVIAAFFVFHFWITRYLKQKADETIGIEKYERNKATIAMFVNPIIGLIIIISVLFNWTSIPAGNEPIAFIFIVIGICFIILGAYKFFRLRR